MTHHWVVFPVLETNNLLCAWRVEVSMDPHEIFLVELPEAAHCWQENEILCLVVGPDRGAFRGS